MNDKEILRNTKAAVGRFFKEVGSNNVTDFITWLDCTMEHMDFEYKQHQKCKSEGQRYEY